MEEKDKIRPRGTGLFLCIDLNEMPDTAVPTDAYTFVRRLHENVVPAMGPPAEHPGESGTSPLLECALCGRPETRGNTIVCDWCERGFHLNCVRIRQRRAAELDEWVCDQCQESGRGSGRWRLGAVTGVSERKSSCVNGGVRLLDINALPPNESGSDADRGGYGTAASGGEDSPTSRPGKEEELFLGRSSKMDGTSDGYASLNKKSSKTADFRMRLDSVDGRCMDESGKARSSLKALGSGRRPVAKLVRRGKLRAFSRSQQDALLESLQDYISKNHGVLEEGWRVEFRQNAVDSEVHAIYRAPEGTTFESMDEVASYLGLKTGEEFGNGFILSHKKLSPLNKKSWEPTRAKCTDEDLNTTINCAESQDGCSTSELSSDMEMEEPGESHAKCEGSKAVNASVQNDSYSAENDSYSADVNIDFPVQYEDFFIHHVGKIKSQPLSDDGNIIWPIGYESSWHDRITGSLFTCIIADGGGLGPIFKVRRKPCSEVPIPDPVTILSGMNMKTVDNERLDIENPPSEMNFDQDEEIQMLLLDHTGLVSLNDYSLLISPDPLKGCQTDGYVFPESTEQSHKNAPSYKDEIGEFLVEGRSSSSVWRMVSQTLLDACHDIIMKSGELRFLCNHDLNEVKAVPLSLSESPSTAGENTESLGRFCAANGPKHIPRVIQKENYLNIYSGELEKWLNQDRFGLDVGFVQELLSKRNLSQLLLLKRKAGNQGQSEEALDEFQQSVKRSRWHDPILECEVKDKNPPPGRPLSMRLSPELVGDVLQIWEFLGRFRDILDIKDPLSFGELEEELIEPWPDEPSFLEKLEKEIQDHRDAGEKKETDSLNTHSLSAQNEFDTAVREDPHAFIQVETGLLKESVQTQGASRTYGRCTGVALAKVHTALLKLLVGELQSKVTSILDPHADAGETRSKRGRKKDSDPVPSKRQKVVGLPINALTWPELARRYVLAILALDGTNDCGDISSRDSAKILRCLSGDGGVLTGSLAGLVGMEADASLLAEAEKQIFDVANEDILYVEDSKEPDMDTLSEKVVASNGSNLPEWAQLLEPVRKLPTNVGTRIRKCIHEALNKDPPDWARKILLHSISKDVYKGNASGPTKKAVLSVLAEVCWEGAHQKPDKAKKRKKAHSFSEVIMKQCRAVLRTAVSADEGKVFCNLLGTTLSNINDNEDEGLLGPHALVSRPLDFRTIDLRLAMGAYGGSHEAFLEDVREVWSNIAIAYADRPHLIQLAECLSQNFESLYEKEVRGLVQKLTGTAPHGVNADMLNDSGDPLTVVCEIPKAPWEDGVCKVCGIDKDDESVLLCDTCDSEYHTYCLNPPLARIPEGNWYCPSCVTAQSSGQVPALCQVMKSHGSKKKPKAVQSHVFEELLAEMGESEYWDLSTKERVFLLKFLCDEALNSVTIREHLEQCQDVSIELQNKLRLQSIEWRNLSFREEVYMKMSKENASRPFGIGEEGRGRGHTGNFVSDWIGQHQLFASGFDQRMTFSSYLRQCLLDKFNTPFIRGGSNGLNKHVGSFFPKGVQENIVCEFSDGSRVKNMDMNSRDRDNAVKSSPVMVSGEVYKRTLKIEHRLPVGIHQNDGCHHICDEHVDSRHSSLFNGSSENFHHELNTDKSNLLPLSAGEMDGPTALLSERGRPPFLEQVSASSLGSAAMRYPFDSSTQFNPENMFIGHGSNNCLGMPEPGESCLPDHLKQEILRLLDAINSTESQLLKVCMRREFLGRDSIGRLYWSFLRSNNYPWLLVDGTVQAKTAEASGASGDPTTNFPSVTNSSTNGRSQDEAVGDLVTNVGYLPTHTNLSGYAQNSLAGCSSCPWIIYETASEIHELIDWLRSSGSQEIDLREWVLQLQRIRPTQVSSTPDNQRTNGFPKANEKTLSQLLNTQATDLLEKKYGRLLESDAGDAPKRPGKKTKLNFEERLFRCDCLEPVWPSRCHCFSCHHTFSTNTELEEHNKGKCNSVLEDKENAEASRGRGMKSESIRPGEYTVELDALDEINNGKTLKYSKSRKKDALCPYDFDDINCRFFTMDYNRDLVREIGLLGSGGVTSFVSAPSFSSIFDPALIIIHEHMDQSDPTKDLAVAKEILTEKDGGVEVLDNIPTSDSGRNLCEKVMDPVVLNSEICPVGASVSKDSWYPLHDRISDYESARNCVVPETSLRPVLGKTSQILKRLKMNLLDMDAALVNEAIKPSRVSLSKRYSWRSFVKSAESILEMVQATIIFENMIKADFLRNGWWYWSSLSAAVKTSTISSLALRIYALDAAIIYQKTDPGLDQEENSKIVKSGKKRKEADV